MTESLAAQGGAFALLAIGLLLWALVPLLERLGGEQAASGGLLGGFLMLAGSTWMGASLGRGLFAEPVPMMSLVLLAWSVVTYLGFQAVPESEVGLFDPPLNHCVPTLVYGAKKRHQAKRSNLRTRLNIDFDVVPTNSRLHVRAHAAGRVYYGLYFVRRPIEVTPDVMIECIPNKDGKCRAIANILDDVERNESPVQVAVDHAIAQSGDEVTIKVTMSAAVGASGGSVGAGGFGFSGSIGLTAAAMSFKVPMGVFIWRCEPKG